MTDDEVSMKLKNILIVVNDIEVSKAFYRDLFGLQVVTDLGENIIFSEGLVLQERKTWEEFTKKEAVPYANTFELYFEEYDLESFIDKLEKSSYKIEYVNELNKEEWGKRAIRIYDPDGHIIEVGEK